MTAKTSETNDADLQEYLVKLYGLTALRLFITAAALFVYMLLLLAIYLSFFGKNAANSNYAIPALIIVSSLIIIIFSYFRIRSILKQKLALLSTESILSYGIIKSTLGYLIIPLMLFPTLIMSLAYGILALYGYITKQVFYKLSVFLIIVISGPIITILIEKWLIAPVAKNISLLHMIIFVFLVPLITARKTMLDLKSATEFYYKEGNDESLNRKAVLYSLKRTLPKTK